MDSAVHEAYYRLEREHWWFQGRRGIVLSMLERYCPNLANARIVDIGAGTGSYAEFLSTKGIAVEAHDSSPLSMKFLRQICKESAQKNFPGDYRDAAPDYDVILLLDMIEHLEDDRSGIQTAVRMLKPGGILLCTVPACKKMWSEYDVISHHRRRYALDEMRALFRGQSLRIEKLSCYATLLFPFLFAVRFWENYKFRQSNREAVYRPHFVPKMLNSILRRIFEFEKNILVRFNLPYGSSIIAVVRKVS